MRTTRMLIALVTLAAVIMLGTAASAVASGGPASASRDAVAEPTPSPTTAPALSLAAPEIVTAGDPASLVVRLGIPGATVRLSRKTATDADFTPIGQLTTDARGVATFRALPRRTTIYRVDYTGDGVLWLPAAADVEVAVRPLVSFSAPERVYRGRRARLAVTVRPAHPGATVILERRQDGVWAEWRSLKLGPDSRAQTMWRPDTDGAWALRVTVAADADHLAGVSLTRRVPVVKPNPYDVPLDAEGIVVVDISQYRLRFYSFGRLLKSFPCVTGRPSLPTPIGRFSIYARGMWPGGPFGARIMSYHSPYAIHGTNEPHLLSRFPRNFSHGCTRLSNADASWLYEHAPLGTPVWNVP